jgi:transposase-like protein
MSRSKQSTPTSKVAEATSSVVSGNRTSEPSQTPDPEVLPKPKRRTFTAAYKVDILKRAEESAPGELGAMLRGEGLYSSHLTKWRKQRDRGALAGLKPKKRGRKSNPNQQLQAEVEKLRRTIQRLEDELSKAHTVIDIQKKVSMLLGEPVTNLTNHESEERS